MPRPLIEIEADVAREPARLVPPDLQPTVLRDLVRAPLEPEVVHLEAWRTIAEADVHARPFAGDLSKADVPGMTAHRCGERIDFEVIRIGALEAVHVVALQRVDRRDAAVDFRSGPVAVQAPALPNPPVVVDAAGDR